MSSSRVSAGLEYLRIVQGLVAELGEKEWPKISSAAELIYKAIAGGHIIHTFGTGHSHMLAEELFYRAGGLVQVKPILFAGLMLHDSAPLSTSLERLPGLASALLRDHPMNPGDVLIVASNSGGNAVVSELVQQASNLNVSTIAITSLKHAKSAVTRESKFPYIHELADIVIDNYGSAGDAAVSIRGFHRKVGPSSTVVGAAILNAMVTEAVQRLVDAGITPDVYSSANLEGGDAVNGTFARKEWNR